MDKRFWGAIAVIAVVFVGIVVINNQGSDKGDSAQATNHVRGDNKQNVTLVEYGDFQCPVCYSYYPVTETIAEKYKDDIKFQFRNFPLQSVHQNAFAASRAAEAAGKQGKFWEMYQKLYQNQDPNGAQGWVSSRDPLNEYFAGYATSIGVANLDQFKSDYASEAINSIINADIAAGNELKVTGTPTFFLDGKQIELKELVGDDGSPSEEKFSQIIDKAIKAKGGTTSVDPNKPATVESANTDEKQPDPSAPPADR